MKIISIILAILFLGFLPLASFAETFSKDGYEIEIYWKQKKNKMSAWGNVSGGKKCKQLNLEIYLENTEETSIGRITSRIKDYTPKANLGFEGTDDVYAKNKNRDKWYVDLITTRCLN